ncbi:MAG: bifunctional diguanylate cyclase/phosphohydrolase [Armatimonadota bacterium]
MKHIRLPLAGRIFLACTGLAFAVSIAASAVLYANATRSLRREVEESLKNTVSIAAQGISAHKYHSMEKMLSRLREENPGVIRVRIVHDRTISGPVIAENRGDASLSGYAPLDGRSDAVRVDMDTSELLHDEAALRKAVGGNLLVAFLASAALSLLATQLILEPLRLFSRAAHRVRHGDFDFQVKLDRCDEIGELAESFNCMLDSLKESHSLLVERSKRDFLTGLYNHMHFHEALEAQLDQAERGEREFCVMVVDLDRFKSINDTLGHLVGDSILKQFADVILGTMRKVDTAARYGGDEFTVILPETDLVSGLAAAERLRAAVEAHEFCATPSGSQCDESEHRHINVTITVGVAAFPNHARTRDALVHAADEALGRMKRISRNSVCAYQPEKGASVPRSLSWGQGAKPAANLARGHADRVTRYALGLGRAVGLSPAELDTLAVAAMLRDIGMLDAPASIIDKPGGLTRQEQEIVRRHPVIGGELLNRLHESESVISAVAHHHERWDGAGYPWGVAGEEIPLMARILAIADAFDAMTSDRAYRKAMSCSMALLEIQASSGKQFDPALAEIFADMLGEIRKAA